MGINNLITQLDIAKEAINVFEIINRYYPTQTRAYSILVHHSLSVASYAISLAEKHPGLSINKVFLYEAAMLHDIGIFLTNAPRIACFGKELYIRHGYLGANLLREIGLPRHALICERHTGAGLTIDEIIVRKLPLPTDRVYFPESLEEQLICYADCFFSKTKLGIQKEYSQVRNKMATFWKTEEEKLFAEAAVKRLDSMHNLFS